MAGAQSHYLRGNTSEWTPRHVAFFDTETLPEEHGTSQLLRLRMWVGGSVDRRPPGAGVPSVRSDHGSDRRSLARWVDAQTVGHDTTWLFAHNLGFDLTTSRLPDFLHRLGWTATQWSLAGRNVTGRMRKRSKTLTLVDSTSWLPHPLQHVGNLLGRHKLPMPPFDAPLEDWVEYCSRDVLVLAEAVLEIMAWWDRNRLGHFSMSGPACGWNAARHQSPGKLFLIKTDEAEVKHDRSAVYGGRRDVTRVGEIAGGPFALVDFSNAYLTVCANLLLPKGRLGRYERFDTDSKWIAGNRFGVIAECEVETPAPRYPLKTPAGVFYPVGRFTTTLTSPEIVWARESGHLRRVGAGYVHDLGYPLAGWARWALSLLNDPDAQAPPVVQAVVKQWGHSVPGKCAARTSHMEARGPALWPGWHLERGTFGPDHQPAADLHVGGRHWWVTFDLEGDNAYPAVFAWVESWCRMALSRMLEALGEDMWVCCDTDGAVLDLTRARQWLHQRTGAPVRYRNPFRVAEAVCEALKPVTWPLVPRTKGLSETLQVAGPQHYAGDTFERAAGRPGKPELDQEGRLRWWTWPRTQWQMESGSPLGYVRVERQWTAPAQLAHRWVLEDGTALPVQAHLNGDGKSHVAGWVPWGDRDPFLRLAPEQSPALRKLRG